MAGGPLADVVACLPCLYDLGRVTKARRVCEGAESDQYCCEQGHTFGIDYRNGPATTAPWPPDPGLTAAFTRQ